MTQAELFEVQTNYTDLLTSAYKFWVTTTFAIIATGYVAGPELGMPISVGIALLYFTLAMGNVATLRYYLRVVWATVVDLEASREAAETPLATVDATITGRIRSAGPMILIILVTGSIGSVAYLLYRASGAG